MLMEIVCAASGDDSGAFGVRFEAFCGVSDARSALLSCSRLSCCCMFLAHVNARGGLIRRTKSSASLLHALRAAAREAARSEW